MIFVKSAQDNISIDVFDTIDLIVDMDDVKDELRTLPISQHGEVPQNMARLVSPTYVTTQHPFVDDSLSELC